MQTLVITPDQLPNLTAQLPAGTITKPSDASYDPGSGVYSFSEDVAPAVNAAFANLVAGSKIRLKSYAAALRFSKEVAGVAIDGKTYPSDRESQGKFTAAAVMSQLNAGATFQWKLTDGSFVALNATQMIAVATAVGAYVGRCFVKEQTVGASIDAGSITTTTDIDTAFAVI